MGVRLQLGAFAGGSIAEVTSDAVAYSAVAVLYAVSAHVRAHSAGAGGGRVAESGELVAQLSASAAKATGAPVTVSRVTVAELELDLEVFSGPFDLLLTLVLREEVDLLEVELADVVVSYLDFLEARGELDLDVATEFLVLIAALLELKSRLMLPREDDALPDLEPGEAAEELLARMLEARRYRRAAEYLAHRLGRGGRPPLPLRAAPARAAPRDRRRRRRRPTTRRSSAPRSARCCALPPRARPPPPRDARA